MKIISVTWSEPTNEAASLAYRLFRRRVQERSGAAVEAGGSAGYVLKLDLDPSLPGESFRIAMTPGGVNLSGADPLGLLYGIGKFLRTARYQPGGFLPSTWQGTSAPQGQVRA